MGVNFNKSALFSCVSFLVINEFIEIFANFEDKKFYFKFLLLCVEKLLSCVSSELTFSFIFHVVEKIVMLNSARTRNFEKFLLTKFS